MSAIGLSTALSSALTGLNVNQQQLAVLSNNIANANTPGYSLTKANQHAIFIDGNGVGVDIKDITRQIDQNLASAVVQQNSVVGQTSIINNYNNQIQVLIGQPGNNNSINTSIGNFFNSLQALAQTPQNNALQQGAVNSGVALASQIQQTAEGMYNLQFQAETDINNAVNTINTDIHNIATLNEQINEATLRGQSVTGLQDQRDAALNELAGYLNISTFTNSNGMINVNTSNGTSLVNNASAYQVSYALAPTVGTFANGGTLSPLLVYQLDPEGNRIGIAQQLASGGTPSQVTTSLTSGKLAGLLEMRDQQIPDILDQLDTLAANLRDKVNAIQNSGSGFPGANSLTGERLVNAASVSQWSGNAQIAVLNSGGQAVSSPYADEPYGLVPLNLDLGSLNTGSGSGNPSVQGIIDAINQYYGRQGNKVELGNLNNIQLVSDSASLPGQQSQLQFDLNLNNISPDPASVYVTGVTVTPSSGANTTSVTSPVDIGISSYTTIANSSIVTVNASGSTSNLTVGEKVHLSGPGTIVDGIDPSDLTGFFTITGIGPTGFTVTAAGGAQAQTGTTVNPVGTVTVTPPYATMPAGQNGRTVDNGFFTAALGANSAAAFYTVTLNVAVDDGAGDPPAMSQITYMVTNNVSDALNAHYAPQTADGDGKIVPPVSTQAIAKAILVDADGNELPKDGNGNYVTTENGYLKIVANSSTNTIAINSLNSSQLGQPGNTPPVPGTNQGFSQYFALNNFFKSNHPIVTGDTVVGSAAALAIVQGLQDNPGLLSIGALTQSTQPISGKPNYTYMLNPGDNSVIQQMASLGTAIINFPTSGGLSAASQTFNGYATSIIGATSSNASAAATSQTNAQTLLTGFQQQVSKVSGVNLDTELANTVIYQNAYAASARVISVTSTLFDNLLSAVGQ